MIKQIKDILKNNIKTPAEEIIKNKRIVGTERGLLVKLDLYFLYVRAYTISVLLTIQKAYVDGFSALGQTAQPNGQANQKQAQADFLYLALNTMIFALTCIMASYLGIIFAVMTSTILSVIFLNNKKNINEHVGAMEKQQANSATGVFKDYAKHFSSSFITGVALTITFKVIQSVFPMGSILYGVLLAGAVSLVLDKPLKKFQDYAQTKGDDLISDKAVENFRNFVDKAADKAGGTFKSSTGRA